MDATCDTVVYPEYGYGDVLGDADDLVVWGGLWVSLRLKVPRIGIVKKGPF